MITSHPEAHPFSVAVLDDDPVIAQFMTDALKSLACQTQAYSDARACVAELTSSPVDVLITDLKMPDLNGLEVLRRIKEGAPSTEVIIATANADKDTAIEALRSGAFDYLEKPMSHEELLETVKMSHEELLETVKRTLRYQAVVKERDQFAAKASLLSKREASRWGLDAFVGESDSMRSVLDDLRALHGTIAAPVMITGESGTGKELVARAIHYGSMCSAGPFVPVNCSAIPADLAESTLFGHKKGSFTGATKDHKGAFDTADGGTLFLDEIGDMPADMQAKLLRVLEDSTVTPVGCSVGHSVNVRIVAATNADLMIKIEKREFRSDLYYRIAAYTIQIPPLRERKSDIPTLARHFAQELAADMGFAPPGIDSKALSLLKDQPFPGNVRELRNVIEGALIRGRGGPIRAEHLITIHRTTNPKALAENEALRPSGAPAGLPLNLNEVEAIAIKRAMAVAHGNVSAAARLLGINRSKLHRKLAALYTP